MITLLGTHHEYQYIARENFRKYESVDTNFNKRPKALMKKIRSLLKRKRVTLIAEEYNFDAKRENRAKLIIAQKLARRFRIKHRWCDPSREQRHRLGLDRIDITRLKALSFIHDWSDDEFNARVKTMHNLREEEWIKRMATELDNGEDILFICGAAHLPTFSDLLIEKGYTDVEQIYFVAPCLEPIS